MNLVLFGHPAFLPHQSMPRFLNMIAEGMKKRGCQVEVWTPQAKFFNLPLPNMFKKWLGYIDQYLLFPQQVKTRIKKSLPETLFVFTDQALGPWVPIVANRPHVIHCHDFLAQLSALGEIPENKTSWTGKKYQAYIRKGYSEGKNFISVSKKTHKDLQRFLPHLPSISEVVYNGMNRSFEPIQLIEARNVLTKKCDLNLSAGFILHVGSNDWYKNRKGVIEIYSTWRKLFKVNLPLLLIGALPTDEIVFLSKQLNFKEDIHFLSGLEDEVVLNAYAAASVLLFPSLAEGFGWPIAEAMASGCPVITTSEAPMSEVAGDAGFLISRRPDNDEMVEKWAEEGAKIVQEVVTLSPEKRKIVVEAGLRNAKRFNTEEALDKIEAIYKRIITGTDVAKMSTSTVPTNTD